MRILRRKDPANHICSGGFSSYFVRWRRGLVYTRKILSPDLFHFKEGELNLKLEKPFLHLTRKKNKKKKCFFKTAVTNNKEGINFYLLASVHKCSGVQCTVTRHNGSLANLCLAKSETKNQTCKTRKFTTKPLSS